jgi:hypothetical protein
MRVLLPLALIFSFSTVALAQEDKPEKVTVSGSREWPPSGPIWPTEGPNPNPGHGCAEPNCGEPLEDPSNGGGATTQKQKDQQNKQNKEKAKSRIADFKDVVKGTTDIINALKKWLSATVGIHWNDVSITYNSDGTKTVKGPCFDANLDFGGKEPVEKTPCVDIKGEPEQVKKQNGVIENQLRLTYSLYYACYYRKECAPVHLSFIAGSQQELAGILNEVLGENHF